MMSTKLLDFLTPAFGTDLYYKMYATSLTKTPFHEPPPPSNVDIIFGGLLGHLPVDAFQHALDRHRERTDSGSGENGKHAACYANCTAQPLPRANSNANYSCRVALDGCFLQPVIVNVGARR